MTGAEFVICHCLLIDTCVPVLRGEDKHNSARERNASSDHGCGNSSADGEFDRANAIGFLIESDLQKGKVMSQSVSTSLITSV